MNAVDIKYLIAKKNESVATLARRFKCRRQELSYCIHGDRKYPKLRKKLARFLGVSISEIFGNQETSERKAA